MSRFIKAQVHTSVFSKQNIKNGFQVTGPIPFYLERVFALLIVVKIPSPPPVVDSIT